jgi:catechol 2,3-dioxygenase-like lactoylglutathione lyase family enzyme
VIAGAPSTAGVHHVAVLTADLGACEVFYADILGLRIRRRWPAEDGSDRSVWLQLGEDGLLMLERADPEDARRGPRGPGWHMLALSIRPADRVAWLERFVGLGVPVVDQTDYTLYVEDPEGNLVGLSHWPQRA